MYNRTTSPRSMSSARGASPQRRHSLMALAVAAALSSGLPTAALAQAADAANVVYELPAQPLDIALSQLARRAGLQLLANNELVKGRQAPALPPTRGLQAALDALLRGSGLRGRVEGTTLLVEAAPAAAAAAETVLPVVRVRASGAQEQSGGASAGYRVKQAGVSGFSEQAIIDTPYSVKVLPAELLANQRVETIAALDRLDAGVTDSATNAGWYGSPHIRGFALDNASNFRFNGQMMINQQATGLENKERVEVLKGLSAMQAGFAAPGGLINYVTKRPLVGALSDLHVSATQFGNAKLHADLSRRSEDGRFGVRLNAAAEEERSYVREVDGGRQFIAVAGDWRVTPDTLLEVDLEHERRNQTSQPTLSANTAGRLPERFNPRTFLGQKWATYPTQFTLLSGKLEHFLSDKWSVLAEANWMKLKRDQKTFYLDAISPSGDADVYHYYDPDQTREPANARLMVKGRFDTGAIAHELAAGVTAHRFEAHWTNGFWGQIGTTNIYDPVLIANPLPSAGKSGLARRDKEGSLFVNDVMAFGEAWMIHLGGRYAMREQRGYDIDSGIEDYRYKKNVFSPSAALVFKPSPSISAYLSYIEGLEQGGTAPLGTTNQDEQLNPLTSKQWEAGVKADMLEGLSAELALFRIDKPAEYTDAANTYVQSGLQRHQGVELSMAGKLGCEWTVFGSAMLLDAALKATGDASTQGKRPTGVPKHRVALTAEYSPRPMAGWTFAGNWTRTGDRPLNAVNTGEFASAFDVLGLAARYETKFGNTPATLRLNIDNLFDRFYWASAAYGSLTASAPRTVSASLSLKF